MKSSSQTVKKFDRDKSTPSIDSHSIVEYCIAIIFLFLLFPGCNREQDQLEHTSLQQWDTLLAHHPEAVRDSLQLIDPEKLSHANRIYHGLLKTIADDKTYVTFTSDSLISEIEQYYSKRQTGSPLHIRSLIYRSIVGIRMGIVDTVAYIPLKEAKRLFVESKLNDPGIGYLLHYYLGDLHYSNNNHTEANLYFTDCLCFAKMENNHRHIFDAYTALFWNEMTKENYRAGKNYLDTLMSLKHISKEEEYNLLNMQSVYYDVQGDFHRSLQCEKQMIHLLPSVKYEVDEFRTQFSISRKFKKLEQPDSALYYGLQAIQLIKDSTYKLNYQLYENIADIALLRRDYKMADEYRRKMFEIYQKSVDYRIEKRILELEKLYDLTDSENKALKAETDVIILTVLSCMLLLLISFILYVYVKRKKIAKLKNDKLQTEKLLAENESLLYQKQAEEYKNIVHIYSLFLTQYSEQQQQLKMFEMKIRGSQSKKPALADDYKKLLEKGQEQFNKLSNQLFLSQIFNNLIELPSEQDLLNEADRLLLIMLALKLDNSQIAAFLNTTLDNLKSRKSYLKRKLKLNASFIGNFVQLMSLF